jgi:predicted esterase
MEKKIPGLHHVTAIASDPQTRTNELADFVDAAVRDYKLAADHVGGVAYSNGVNIAAACYCLGRKLCTRQFYFAQWCR